MGQGWRRKTVGTLGVNPEGRGSQAMGVTREEMGPKARSLSLSVQMR